MAAQQTSTTSTTNKTQGNKDNHAFRVKSGFIPNGCTIV